MIYKFKKKSTHETISQSISHQCVPRTWCIINDTVSTVACVYQTKILLHLMRISFFLYFILYSQYSPFSDSENMAVTLSALLAGLNSCCNPWIYMLFGGHLLYDFLHCFPCCQKLNYSIRNDSDSSLKRNTLLSKLPGACTPTNASDSWRDSQKNSQSVTQDCSHKVNQRVPVDSSHETSQSIDNLDKHSHANPAQVLNTDS